MRKYFTIWLLLITVKLVLAQNVDSLKQLLPISQNKEKVDIWFALSKAYWFKNHDTALNYASEAMKLSRYVSYTRGIAEAYRHMGAIHMFSYRNSQDAKRYLDTALHLFQRLKDTAGLAATYNNQGLLLGEQLGRPLESLAAYQKALIHFRRVGNSEGEGSVLNYMGLTYSIHGDFQNATDYTLQALQIRKMINDIPGAMHCLNNLGNMYRVVGYYETALKYYMDALQLANEKKVQPLSNTYLYLTELYIALKTYDKAKKYVELAIRQGTGVQPLIVAKFYTETGQYNKALPIYERVLAGARKGPNYLDIANSKVGISKVYQLRKDYPIALKYAKDAYLIADQYHFQPVLSQAAGALSSIYAIRGDYHKAYKYERINRSITDSINTQDYHRKLAFVETKSEMEKKQSRIDLLNKENQIKEQRLKREALLQKILIGGILAMLLVAFVWFRNILLKRKSEKHLRELAENELQLQKLESERTQAELKQQATQLEMQALRAQMNPHFIFNSLNSINRFILKNQSNEATEYLSKFSQLIRMILHSSSGATVSLTEDLEALQLYMELESLRFEQKFSYAVQCDPEVDADFICVPPMLLQPFVENAIWHGLMHKEGQGHLQINIGQEETTLVCTITDNGIGRKKAMELKSKSANRYKSMGMRITADRIALLKGQIEGMTSIQISDLTLPYGLPGGTEVKLKIPIVYD